MTNNIKSRWLLIITTDKLLDRRTLQQSDTLINNGWRVTIASLYDQPHLLHDQFEILNVNKCPSITSKKRILHPIIERIKPTVRRYKFIEKIIREFFFLIGFDPEKYFKNLFVDIPDDIKPNIVMAVDLPTLPVAYSFSRQTGAKLLYDTHELYPEQDFGLIERKKWRKIEKKYFKHCDAVITVNDSLRDYLVQKYKYPNVNTILNSINARETNRPRLDFFHQSFNLPPDKKILLYQGGLIKDRNLEKLVKSMRYVQDKNTVLVLMGDGYIKPKLEKLIIKMNQNLRIFLHPAVPQNILLDYTSAADVGIIPYQPTCLNNKFCTPNKLFEFIAAGIPFLCDNLPELVSFQKKYQVGSVDSLKTCRKIALAIDKIFSDKQKLEQYKNNTLNARDIISWSHQEIKVLQIVEGIL